MENMAKDTINEISRYSRMEMLMFLNIRLGLSVMKFLLMVIFSIVAGMQKERYTLRNNHERGAYIEVKEGIYGRFIRTLCVLRQARTTMS